MIYSIAETAKANNLKPYEYFKLLLEVIPKHMEDTDRSFLDVKGVRHFYINFTKTLHNFTIARYITTSKVENKD